MIRISKDVLFEVLDGEAVLLELESGTYFQLNRTGTRMWQLMQEHGDPDRIVSQIADEFDAPAERIRQDLDALVADLAANGLIDSPA